MHAGLILMLYEGHSVYASHSFNSIVTTTASSEYSATYSTRAASHATSSGYFLQTCFAHSEMDKLKVQYFVNVLDYFSGTQVIFHASSFLRGWHNGLIQKGMWLLFYWFAMSGTSMIICS